MSYIKLEQILYTWRYVEYGMNGLGLYASSSRDQRLNSAAEEIAGKFVAEDSGDISRFVVYSEKLDRFVGIRVSPNFNIPNHARREAMVHVFIPETGSLQPEDFLLAYPFDSLSPEDQSAGRLPDGPVSVPRASFDEQAVMEKMGFLSGDQAEAVTRLAVLVKMLFRNMLGETDSIFFKFSRDYASPFSDSSKDDRSAAELIWLLSFLLPYSKDGKYIRHLTYSINSTNNKQMVNISFSEYGEGIIMGRNGLSVPVKETPEEFYLKIAERAIKEGLESAKNFIKKVMEDSPALRGEGDSRSYIRYSYYKWKMKSGQSLDYEDIRSDFSAICIYCNNNFWFREFLIEFYMQNRERLDDDTLDEIWYNAISPNLDILAGPDRQFERVRPYTIEAAGSCLNENYRRNKLIVNRIPKKLKQDVIDSAVENERIEETFIFKEADRISNASGLADYIDSYSKYLATYENLRKKTADRADGFYVKSKNRYERKQISDFMENFYSKTWNEMRQKELDSLTSLSAIRQYAEDYGSCIEEKYYCGLLDRMINLDVKSITSPKDYRDVWVEVKKIRQTEFADMQGFESYESRFMRRLNNLDKDLEEKQILNCDLKDILEYPWDDIRFPENCVLWTGTVISRLQEEWNFSRETVALALNQYDRILSGFRQAHGDNLSPVKNLLQAYWDFVFSDSAKADDRAFLWMKTRRASEDKKFNYYKKILSDDLLTYWQRIKISDEEFRAMQSRFEKKERDCIDKLLDQYKDSSYAGYNRNEQVRDNSFLKMNIFRMYYKVQNDEQIIQYDLRKLKDTTEGDIKEKAFTILYDLILKMAGEERVPKNRESNLIKIVEITDPKLRLEFYKGVSQEKLEGLKDLSKDDTVKKEMDDFIRLCQFVEMDSSFSDEQVKILNEIVERRKNVWTAWTEFHEIQDKIADYFSKYDRMLENMQYELEIAENEVELRTEEDDNAARIEEVKKQEFEKAREDRRKTKTAKDEAVRKKQKIVDQIEVLKQNREAARGGSIRPDEPQDFRPDDIGPADGREEKDVPQGNSGSGNNRRPEGRTLGKDFSLTVEMIKDKNALVAHLMRLFV